MKIKRIIIPALLCMVLSCSVRVKPYPATQRLTVKIPVTFAIELSKIPETEMVNGSACIRLFNFGKKSYEVHLREGFQSGAEYSFVDFAEKIETLTDTASKRYDIIYQPELTAFEISAILETRLKVKVKITSLRGKALLDKEYTGISQNSNSACIMGFVGNFFFQNMAIEMSVKSAMENFYEQLYMEMISNPEFKKLQAHKEQDKQPDSNAEKNVTVVLKDGSEIVGVIISQDETILVIKTRYTTMKIKKDKVEVINYK